MDRRSSALALRRLLTTDHLLDSDVQAAAKMARLAMKSIPPLSVSDGSGRVFEVAELLSRHRPGGTARSAALGGSEHSVRSLATWPVEDREGTESTPEVAQQSGQLCVEGLKSRDPLGDRCTSFLDHAGQLGG
jgi:hypothetical protein